MKKIIQYLVPALVMFAMASCKEDVPTLFNESDGIYFSAKDDSLFYSFAKYPNRLTDTIKLPVTLLGKPAGVDRVITAEKGTGTDVNAIEGTHYRL